MLLSAQIILFAIPYIRNTTVSLTQMKSELSQIELLKSL